MHDQYDWITVFLPILYTHLRPLNRIKIEAVVKFLLDFGTN